MDHCRHWFNHLSRSERHRARKRVRFNVGVRAIRRYGYAGSFLHNGCASITLLNRNRGNYRKHIGLMWGGWSHYQLLRNRIRQCDRGRKRELQHHRTLRGLLHNHALKKFLRFQSDFTKCDAPPFSDGNKLHSIRRLHRSTVDVFVAVYTVD